MNYLFDQYKTVYTAEGMDLSAYSAKELQSGYEIVMLIDVDKDGITDLNYNVVKREYLYNTEHEIINFRCEQGIPSHVEF